jgi:acyl-CoA thioesterase FadM
MVAISLLSSPTTSSPRSVVAVVVAVATASLARAFDPAVQKPTSSPPAVTFRSQSFHVYIEDTDAYGVMYNANYLRAYERAMHTVSFKPPSYVTSFHSDGSDDEGSLDLLDGGALDHAGWFVLGVTDHKFKGSPPLGGEYIVEGELLERNCDEGSSCLEEWKLVMKSPAIEMDGENGNSKPTIYNTATLTIASPSCSGMLSPQYHPNAPPFDENNGATVRSTFQPFRDEFDPLLPHRMPLRNVLNLFERARTDYLGGPDALRKMEKEDNIVWVVTSVDNCELCNLGEAGWEEEDKGNDESPSSLVQCLPGQSVTVKTSFVSTRGGMILNCNQMLLVPAWDEKAEKHRNRRLAQASITIVALDAQKRRPSRKIPQWFLDKISGGQNN